MEKNARLSLSGNDHHYNDSFPINIIGRAKRGCQRTVQV